MRKYIVKFLWLEKSIGVSLDQTISGKTTPLTEYFFWPRNDAWEEMKLELERRSWISQNDSILVLNQVTDVINFWQEKSESNRKKELTFAKEKFPSSIFVGHD